MLYMMFSFLHRLVVLLHKISIYRQELRVFLDMLFYSQKQAAADLNFINHQGSRLQLKSFLLSTQEKKVTYICNGLNLSKLTSIFHF